MFRSSLSLSCCLILSLASLYGVYGQECSTEAPDTTASSLSDTVHQVMTESAEDVRVAALCHVACINYVLNPGVANSTNGSMMNNGSSGEGPAVMPGVYAIPGCGALRKYLDCRSGCIAGSMGQCGTCATRCPGLCDGFPNCKLGLDGNQCGAECNSDDCNHGCQQSSALSPDQLTKPMAPPVLTQIGNERLYDVEFPMELEINMFSFPSFVFRIEYSPGQFVYQWMVDVMITNEITINDYLLDLSSFSGVNQLRVSYAFVSQEMGVSPYSDAVVPSTYVFQPSSLSDTVHEVVTESADDVRVAALCHIACINYILNPGGANSTNGSMMNGSMTMDAMTPGVYEIQSCGELRKYLDCRNGCIAQSNGQCGTCATRCPGLCDGFPNCRLGIDGNRCGAECNSDDCNHGCQQYSALPSDQLMKPMGPPVLTQIGNQLLYSVEIPMDLEINMFSFPSLVFRIEYSPGQFVYQWMVDVMLVDEIRITDHLLDLSSFTGGSQLNISFAFVSQEMGLSPYSDSVEIVVPEACVVEEFSSRQVAITHERDTRVGFFNHPVFTVSWCPTTCTEGVENYTVTTTPLNCEEASLSTEVNSTTSSVVLRSTTSDGFFDLPCQIQVEIKTNLVGGTSHVFRETIIISVPHMDQFAKPVLSCPFKYNAMEEKYEVDFSLMAPYSPATLNIIDFFVVRADAYQFAAPGQRDPTPVELGQIRRNIDASVEESSYGTTLFLNPFEVRSRFYEITVEVRWKVSEGLPAIANYCHVTDVNAPPPQLITNIEIVNKDTSEITIGEHFRTVQAFVTVQFEAPDVQYQAGTTPIRDYQIYFGRERLEPDGNSSSLSTISALRGEVAGTFENVPKEGNTFTAYIQVRSRQFQDFPSNWSDPEPVEIIALQHPPPLHPFNVTLSRVNVVYIRDMVMLRLNGNATWDEVQLDDDIELETYRVTTEPGRLIVEPEETRVEFRNEDFELPHNHSLAIVFRATYRVSLEDKEQRGREEQTSIPSNVTVSFQPLPHPQNITVTLRNPRLNNDELSVELTVEWDQPQFEYNITNYEIKFRTDSPLREFDEFLVRAQDEDKIAPQSTALNKSLDMTVDPQSPTLLVQMRSIMTVTTEVNFLPVWSDPVSVQMIILPPPVITDSQLLSFSLTSSKSSDDFSVTAELQLSWEDFNVSEDLYQYEVWVGSKALDEFEEPDSNENLGQILQFPADSSTTENANTTMPENTTTDNSTTSSGATTTTEMISAAFSSTTNNGTIYIQIRSVSTSEIPKWSTPAVAHRSQPSPQVNFEIVDTEFDRDLVKSVVTVKADLEWELPAIDQIGGGGGVITDSTDPPTQPRESSSSVPTPSPSPRPPRKRRQIQTEQPSSSSGMGSGAADDGPVPEPLGDIEGICVYMGREELDTYAPGPMENVKQFKEDVTSGTVEMDFAYDGKEGLTLYVQMQIKTEGGFPVWSEAQVINVPSTGEVRGSSGSDPTLPIVFGVVGAVILVIIVAIGIIIFCLIRNRYKYKIDIDGGEGIDIYSRPGLTGIYSGKGPILDEWEISTDDVIVDELLGEGAFGEVYKGVIRGPLENPKISAVLRQAIGVPVAIKLLKITSAGKEKADFLAEIDMMKKIAEGYNTHIVNMVGCVTLQEPLCLITEFVPYGDLLSYLKYQRKKRSESRRREKLQRELEQNQTEADEYVITTTPVTAAAGGGRGGGDGYEDTTTGGGGGRGGGGDAYETPEAPQPAPYLEPPNAYSHLDPKPEEPEVDAVEDSGLYGDLGDLEPDDLIRFAYQIASGMEYLASLSIVHRDLACRNVLIAKDKLLKITDFGLSREVQEVYVKKTRGRLPLKWMAIESITAREFTTASDVWAFGVTLYEIGTIGGFPYPSINNEDLLRMLSQGYRLEKPDNCSPEVYALMLECWQEDPQDRPSFSGLRTKFSFMIQAGSPDAYIDLQVNEEAPYYQVKDEEKRESDSDSSADSDDSVDSLNKQKIKKEKKKLKRRMTNPYVPTPNDQPQGEGQTPANEGDEGYIPMQSAGSVVERPVQLGIPISQLVPSSQTDHQTTPVDDSGTPMDSRKTNPYVSEPSELTDSMVVSSSVPLIVTAGNGEQVGGNLRDSELELLTESTHL